MTIQKEISSILLNTTSLNDLIINLKRISIYGSNDQVNWLLEDVKNISLIAKKGDCFYVLESPYKDFEVFCIDVYTNEEIKSLNYDGFVFYKIVKD